MTTTKKSSIVYTPRTESFWDIPEVLYRGEKGTYRLFDRMTSSMTQDQHAEFYEKEKQKGNPYPTDMPLMWAIATQAFELRDDGNEALRKFLKNGFRAFANTLTRIVYNPLEDCVIHNYGTADAYSLHGNIVGSDEVVNRLADPAVLENIVGTQDIQKINEVSQYINETNAYLWRLNSKPKQKDKRVARFGAYGGGVWLVLGCVGYPRDEFPAFRVLRVD